MILPAFPNIANSTQGKFMCGGPWHMKNIG